MKTSKNLIAKLNQMFVEKSPKLISRKLKPKIGNLLQKVKSKIGDLTSGTI